MATRTVHSETFASIFSICVTRNRTTIAATTYAAWAPHTPKKLFVTGTWP